MGLNIYTIDQNTGFYSVNLEQILNAEQADQALSQVKYDARIEVLKSIPQFTIGTGATALVTAAAVVAFKVTSLAIGILTFPLVFVPPLYFIASSIGSLAIGGGVGYFTYRKYAKPFIEEGKRHWNHAMHLYNQKELLQTRKAQLAGY